MKDNFLKKLILDIYCFESNNNTNLTNITNKVHKTNSSDMQKTTIDLNILDKNTIIIILLKALLFVKNEYETLFTKISTTTTVQSSKEDLVISVINKQPKNVKLSPEKGNVYLTSIQKRRILNIDKRLNELKNLNSTVSKEKINTSINKSYINIFNKVDSKLNIFTQNQNLDDIEFCINEYNNKNEVNLNLIKNNKNNNKFTFSELQLKLEEILYENTELIKLSRNLHAIYNIIKSRNDILSRNLRESEIKLSKHEYLINKIYNLENKIKDKEVVISELKVAKNNSSHKYLNYGKQKFIEINNNVIIQDSLLSPKINQYSLNFFKIKEKHLNKLNNSSTRSVEIRANKLQSISNSSLLNNYENKTKKLYKRILSMDHIMSKFNDKDYDLIRLKKGLQKNNSTSSLEFQNFVVGNKQFSDAEILNEDSRMILENNNSKENIEINSPIPNFNREVSMKNLLNSVDEQGKSKINHEQIYFRKPISNIQQSNNKTNSNTLTFPTHIDSNIQQFCMNTTQENCITNQVNPKNNNFEEINTENIYRTKKKVKGERLNSCKNKVTFSSTKSEVNSKIIYSRRMKMSREKSKEKKEFNTSQNKRKPLKIKNKHKIDTPKFTSSDKKLDDVLFDKTHQHSQTKDIYAYTENLGDSSDIKQLLTNHNRTYTDNSYDKSIKAGEKIEKKSPKTKSKKIINNKEIQNKIKDLELPIEVQHRRLYEELADNLKSNSFRTKKSKSKESLKKKTLTSQKSSNKTLEKSNSNFSFANKSLNSKDLSLNSPSLNFENKTTFSREYSNTIEKSKEFLYENAVKRDDYLVKTVNDIGNDTITFSNASNDRFI